MNDPLNYTEKDFVYKVSFQCFTNSNFDELVQKKWKEKMESGAFRYYLKIDAEKTIDGIYNFYVLMNKNRIKLKRRPSQAITFLTPYKPEKFNFTQVTEDEKMFKIININRSPAAVHDDIVLINVSPILFGHILLCPDVYGGLRQSMTEYGLHMAIELILLSGDPNFRLGFNSIAAEASVNHLHMHGLYLNRRMKLETIAVQQVKGPCYKLVDFPSYGFVFQVKCFEDVNFISKCAFRLFQYLNEKQIAHNMCLTRGIPVDSDDKEPKSDSVYRCVRMYIWPRRDTKITLKHIGSPAFFEMFGGFVCTDEQVFGNLKEDTLSAVLTDMTEELFNQILPDVTSLFESVEVM